MLDKASAYFVSEVSHAVKLEQGRVVGDEDINLVPPQSLHST
jgi:hypothetical protein